MGISLSVGCGRSGASWLSVKESRRFAIGNARSFQGAGALGQADNMIVLFTDFGLDGPYAGQMKAVLHQMAPGIPHYRPLRRCASRQSKASTYLLAAYAAWFPARTVFLCVVDPGFGGTRPSIFLEADGRWYIGPGNGLFELIQRRARETRSWDIDWILSVGRRASTSLLTSKASYVPSHSLSALQSCQFQYFRRRAR